MLVHKVPTIPRRITLSRTTVVLGWLSTAGGTASSNVQVINNTVYGNKSYNGIAVWGTVNGLTIKNNIVVNNVGFGIGFSWSGITNYTVANNLIFGNTYAAADQAPIYLVRRERSRLIRCLLLRRAAISVCKRPRRRSMRDSISDRRISVDWRRDRSGLPPCSLRDQGPIGRSAPSCTHHDDQPPRHRIAISIEGDEPVLDVAQASLRPGRPLGANLSTGRAAWCPGRGHPQPRPAGGASSVRLGASCVL